MTELKTALLKTLEELGLFEINQAKEKLEMEMRLIKAERGNETLQERIKEKDAIIADLKDVIKLLKIKGEK